MNETARLAVMIAVMAGVTYLIRMLPMLLVKRQLKSRLLRSFLYYVPYAVLAAMIIPDIFFATATPISAAAALTVAVILAFAGRSLLTVALAACVSVYIVELIMRLFGMI